MRCETRYNSSIFGIIIVREKVRKDQTMKGKEIFEPYEKEWDSSIVGKRKVSENEREIKIKQKKRKKLSQNGNRK